MSVVCVKYILSMCENMLYSVAVSMRRAFAVSGVSRFLYTPQLPEIIQHWIRP